jgi:hypothetical protein
MLSNHELTLARGRFSSLQQVMPGRHEPKLGLASVELQAGQWRKSLALYQEVAQQASDPQISLSASAAAAAIEREHDSRVSMSMEVRNSNGGTLSAPVRLNFYDVNATKRLSEAWRVSAQVDTVRASTDQALRSNGVISQFSGNAVRTTLGLQHDALNGVQTAAALFVSSNRVGLGLNYRRPDDYGSTRLSIETRQANWDYLEGIVDGAFRDRAAIARTQRFNSNLTGNIEIGTNRYTRINEGRLASSNTLAAQLRLNTLFGLQGVSGAYSVNGEYLDKRLTKTDSQGVAFTPLPIVNREIHSATLGYFRRTTLESKAVTTLDIYAGFGKDRYARQGELMGATVSYENGPIEIKARLGYVRNLSRTKGSSSSVGISMTIHF